MCVCTHARTPLCNHPQNEATVTMVFPVTPLLGILLLPGEAIRPCADMQGSQRSILNLQVARDIGHFRQKQGCLSIIILTFLKKSLELPSLLHPMTDLSIRYKGRQMTPECGPNAEAAGTQQGQQMNYRPG